MKEGNEAERVRTIKVDKLHHDNGPGKNEGIRGPIRYRCLKKGTLTSTRIREEPTVRGNATKFSKELMDQINKITYSTSNQKVTKENEYCILKR